MTRDVVQVYLDTDLIILTHWGRVTHICVSKLTIINSDNGLSPNRRQAIIWTNIGILFIGPLGITLSEIQTFSFKKMHLQMSSAKCRPSFLGLNVLTQWSRVTQICVDKLTIMCSDNSLSHGRRRAIIWTNAVILLIGPLATNFSDIWSGLSIFIQENAFEIVVCGA